MTTKDIREMPNTAERKQILDRQGWVCYSCKKEIADFRKCNMDHIKALCMGGDNSKDNFVALCKSCHSVKTSHEKYSTIGGERLYKVLPFNHTLPSYPLYKMIAKMMLKHFTPKYASCYKERYEAYYRLKRWIKWARKNIVKYPGIYEYKPKTAHIDFAGCYYTGAKK